jgi:F-type H+-transporting ATPase subunit gamma
MRLIAMSAHSRLRLKKPSLEMYLQESESLLSRMLSASSLIPSRPLVVYVGSQKGLCGTFNSQVAAFVQRHNALKRHDGVVIGAQLALLLKPTIPSIKREIGDFSLNTLKSVVEDLANFIIQSDYDGLWVISNINKSFFMQIPEMHLLSFGQGFTPAFGEKYALDDNIDQLEAFAFRLSLTSFLYRYLYESLFAEQAARFLSMDGATRNADTLLQDMKIDYNKLRQANITRELTDLVSSRLI